MSNTHFLECWAIDIDNRRILREYFPFEEIFYTELGQSPRPTFDAEAATFFQSLRPPQ